jgi:hypothetical protein
MASKTVTLLTDDLDGSEAVESVSFSLDGQDYVIDLNAEHARDLRERITEWSQHARKVGGRVSARAVPQPRSSSSPVSSPKQDVTAVRQWAKGAGYEVSSRGRIAAKIMAAYKQAMGQTAAH